MRRQDLWAAKFINESLPKLLAAVRPSRVIIFGSRAWRDAGEGSDLDVIVVADPFEGMSFLKRMPFLLKLAQFEKHIDFFAIPKRSTNELKKLSLS